MELTSEIEKLKQTSGKKFFDASLQEVFPEKDFFLSTEVDKYDFVLKLEKDENNYDYIKKIELKK